MFRRTRIAALAAFLTVFLSGCGGGSGTPTPAGRATFRIDWNPAGRAVSRLIPQAANSIKITLAKDSDTLDSFVMNRPAPGDPLTTTHTFENLPTGALSATASTYTQTNGEGTVLSTNSTAITVVSGETAQTTLSLNSTITSLVADYTRTTLMSTETQAISVTGRDAQGSILPITTNALTWTTADSTIVTATGGTVAYVGPGRTTVTATDAESTLHVAIPVVAMSFTTSESNAAVSVRGTRTFTAAIAGPTDTTSTWTKISGVGTFNTTTGVFTAGTVPGSAVLRAISTFDPTRTRDISVTVQAGSAAIGVN